MELIQGDRKGAKEKYFSKHAGSMLPTTKSLSGILLLFILLSMLLYTVLEKNI